MPKSAPRSVTPPVQPTPSSDGFYLGGFPVQATTAGQPLGQHFIVRMPEPASHLFEVEWWLTIPAGGQPTQIKFPVWTPGSYLVRDYARFVQDLAVVDAQDQPVSWQRLNRSTWELAPTTSPHLRLHYRVYAYELTVRTNHLDPTHGYFNGAALFFYPVGRQEEAIALTIQVPFDHWRVATALPSLQPPSETGHLCRFVAQNFDQLVDCPVEVGVHQRQTFWVEDKPHHFVVWGQGNEDLEKITQATQRIVETEAALFGGLPYDEYLFLLHLAAEGGGGLEHRTSTTLNYPRFDFGDPKRYSRFLSLVAHEFFHLWNVKRLRPQALETFDYDQEAYFTSLWFCEGTTSYYDTLILRRAGLISAADFLQSLGTRIGQLQRSPGRHHQSLTESSLETWIKLYRPHENSANSQISYYLKGEIVSALLDLDIRRRSPGQSLDQVLQDLWQRFGKQERGYTEAELRAACEQAAGGSLADFFRDYVDGTKELDYEPYLRPFGLALVPHFSQANPAPSLGFTLKTTGGIQRLEQVEMGSPAQKAGLWAGDELVAVEGFKVTAAQLGDRLKSYKPGQTISVTYFQREELKTALVTLAPPTPDQYRLEPLPNPSAKQQARYQTWLGEPLKDLKV